VDITYIPFVERVQIAFAELFKHDITKGRPKLATWLKVSIISFVLNFFHSLWKWNFVHMMKFAFCCMSVERFFPFELGPQFHDFVKKNPCEQKSFFSRN